MLKNSATDPEWEKFQKFLREKSHETAKNDSGQGVESVLPVELKGLNWGACLLNVVWGAAMKVPVGTVIVWAILLMVPFVAFVFPIYLLFKGNEIAWQNRKWDSKEQFLETQKKWTIYGIAIGIFVVAAIIALTVFIYSQIGHLLRM